MKEWMLNLAWLYNPWLWTFVSLGSLLLCTYLPVKVKNPELRRFLTYAVLIPLSIVIVAYVYPVGIEFCRRWAVGQ